MPSPNSVFTEMVTTTLRNHPSEVADNVSKHNALYRRLRDRNKIKKLSGGYEIVRPLDYAENATYQRYSGYDTLNVSASDVLSAAKFDWVQAAVHVTASGRELRMNNGKEQIIDLASSRTRNAMRTAANNMSLDLYSDGSLANQMGGLANIIQNAGTGTVGGINSSTYTFWQNKFLEITGTNTWTKSTIKGFMNTIWLTLVRGTDKPDLVVSTHDFFSAYWESLQDLQRYASADDATAGFQSLKYVTADVIFDSNTNFATTGEKMYFLNTDYLEMVVHRDANWTTLDEKMSINQDGVVIPIIWQGQLTCSNRALQGVMIDAS
ncbi:phage major capsid protein [Rhizobium lentis]|uniref:phage major capsid protein n=1 Tax=Rhizobium lentis TaxID=1138194 RepID=UPI001C82FC7F|nr:phage major capsid protein [Rhizobium lentis]MBX5143232.1 phage major capsid protein [Rhizobium lentis]